MYQKLVKEKEIFTSISSFTMGTLDPGLVVFNGRVKDGIDLKDAEVAVYVRHCFHEAERRGMIAARGEHAAVGVAPAICGQPQRQREVGVDGRREEDVDVRAPDRAGEAQHVAGAGLPDAPLMHENHHIGHAGCKLHFVGDQNHGHAIGSQAFNDA